MDTSNRLDLVELPAADAEQLRVTQDFYTAAFGWSFTSYGPSYADSTDSGTSLGINAVPDEHHPSAPLPVLHVVDLEATRAAIVAAGGRILHDAYDFPGGRRLHFVDPAGNELAAWSE